MNKKTYDAHQIAVIALLTAVSFVAVLVGRLIPTVAGFLSYDPKDAVIVIGGFIFGPAVSVIITLLCSFIEMVTISSTGIYGFIMNVVATLAFALPAAIIYKKMHNMKGAVIGFVCSVLLMTIIMMLWNYVITPYYMGVPRETVAGMMMTVFAPFNLIKGGINAGLTMVLYKPLVTALRQAKLLKPSQSETGKVNIGFIMIGAFILITFILLFLVLIGVL